MKRSTVSERALVLAPRGRDAAIARGILDEAGLAAEDCSSLPDLIAELNIGAAFVIVTEEALATADLAPLSAWIGDQEDWSDLPFVMLTTGGAGLERNPAARRNLDLLGNVTFLERPFHPTTLVSLARSALRSRRRQYEARGRLDALRQNEERLSLVVDGAADYAILTTDLDRRVTSWSAGAQATFGYSAAEIIGQLSDILFTPEDREAGQPLREAEGARREGCASDVRWHLRKDGSRVFVNGSARLLRDRAGREIGLLKIARDETERRRADEALRESEARYRTLFENIDEGFCIVEFLDGPNGPMSDYVHVEANPAYSANAGIPDIVGKRLREIVGDEADAWAETYRNVLLSGEPIRFERELVATGRHLELAAFRLDPASSRQVAVLFRDVTARKQAELALREMNETLEQRVSSEVAERSKAEEALRQAQKMEAMGQLTGGVAHDFNNLLTPIVGSLDMLQRKGLGSAREQRLIAGAAQSAERAKILVQRLLAFARRQPLQAVPVDVARLVTGMGGLVASTTGPQIKVVVEAPEDLPLARADPNQLEMALLNLSVNARDAMPNGGTLRITAREEAIGRGHRSSLPAGAYVCLSVADTGCGMDEATLARAIEPFFSTKGIGKGTGLGLSMVHGLASQLGGALTIQTHVGLGTNVELWLPQTTDLPAIPEPAPEATLVARRGTALLVDDEEVVRLSTADMLSDLGYAVLEAASAEDAMRLVDRGERFDLLVTDHLMPGMNGTDLARAIRSLLPAVPVLVVSGYAESEGIEPDLPRLTKPFRKDELAASLALLSTPR